MIVEKWKHGVSLLTRREARNAYGKTKIVDNGEKLQITTPDGNVFFMQRVYTTKGRTMA